MAKKKKQSDEPKRGVRISNRKAWHDYNILEKLECGIVLEGTEVKSLRMGQAKIDEAYARIDNGELFLVSANIAPYPMASDAMQHEPTRKRRLLLHRRQIHELLVQTQAKGKTLVPLAMYFSRGWAKCEIAVAEGKQKYDKRQSLKDKQHNRDMARAMRRRR